MKANIISGSVIGLFYAVIWYLFVFGLINVIVDDPPWYGRVTFICVLNMIFWNLVWLAYRTIKWVIK